MIVLDSSFLVGFHNTRDAHHASAREVMARLVGEELGVGLLPEYVFLEVVTVLSRRRGPATALAVGDLLLRAREVELVPCSQYFAETLRTFQETAGLGLSFADAAIVAIARARKAAVATFDDAFAKVSGITVMP